jgi:hypothetical protein
MGLFSVAREYAAPSYFAIVAATILGLALQKRRWEAAVFAAVTACFVAPLVSPLAAALHTTLTKGSREEWFHPLSEWIPHVSVYTVGPALTVALIALVAAGLYRSAAHRELAGLRGLIWAHLLLLAFYLGGLVWVRNRVSRLAIPPMIVAAGLALIGTRLSPEIQRALRTTRAKGAVLALIAASWSVLSYQLFVAFDGGETYAHAAYRLEYYNHPLRLRALRGPLDSYVCFDPCPYD